MDHPHIQHRGRKNDPLYRCRRLLTKAQEGVNERGREKLLGLLQADDPKQVTTVLDAKEATRGIYDHTDEALAREWIDQLIDDLADPDQPIDARSLGRTLKHWKEQIVASHRSQATNGPTLATNRGHFDQSLDRCDRSLRQVTMGDARSVDQRSE